MNRRTIIVASAAALLGAGSLHVYLKGFEENMAGGPRREVVMLTQDISQGQLITRSALSVRPLPEHYLEDRHILSDDLERVVGTRATTAVHGGSSLLWSDLDIMQEGRTLSGLVRSGMRAYALSDRDATFDGLLRPGDRVDVLFTDEDGARTTTLLQNVLVLTVGGDLGVSDDEEDAERVRQRSGRVTLSVNGAQAQLLAHSNGRGRLKLLLRNPQDLVIAEGMPEVNDPSLQTSEPTEGAAHVP